MYNAKYFSILFLLVSVSIFGEEVSSQKRNQEEMIRLGYLKAGTELGIGYRQHRGPHGFDISLNQAFCFYPNWINVKGLYMHYPYYTTRHFFYWGLGAGINYEFNYHSDSSGLGGIFSGCSHCHHNRVFPSLEGVIGYEFFTGRKIRMFVQGGLSVPVGEASLPFVPALSVGIGF